MSAPPDEVALRGEPPDAWDRSADWLAAHGALPALGILTIAMGVLYAHLFTGETVGDDLTFHMAESARLADCLRHGDWDFWNPSANAGFASIYYYQAIPQLASAIPTAIFGHHLFWFELSVVLPHVLAPAAAYRGVRLMGGSPWQAFIAAFAIAFMNGESRWGAGNAGTFQVGLYTQTWALAAFPLAVGHAARWIMDRKGLAPAIAWGTFVWLCHPFAGVSLGIVLIAAFAALAVLATFDGVFVQLGHALDVPAERSAFHAIVASVGRRWREPPARPLVDELVRSFVLGILLLVAWMPIYLPLLLDYDGFGGFPHRVSDEVGPGFKTLADWHVSGKLLDHKHFAPVLTIALPFVLVFARTRFLRWLWAPSLVFALLLGIGPHIGKTSGDDLFPAVRFLGALQVLLALGIGAGIFAIARAIYMAPEGSPLHRPVRLLVIGLLRPLRRRELAERLPLQYGIRTALAALTAALGVIVAQGGWRALDERIHVLADYPNDRPGAQRKEIFEIIDVLAHQPQGRKQAGPGTENHWWNLLTYVYARVPSLLQMGGGGLQASPNYDFVWSVRDFKKLAWVYDAPYLVYTAGKGGDQPAGETVVKTATHEVRRLPSPGLVSPVQITGVLPAGPSRAGTPTRKAALDWLRGELPYANHHLAYAGHGAAGAAPDAKIVRAWRQDSPGDDADIVAEVDATKPSTLVARESWHPRWRAYVDGREVTIRRVTPDFPAIDVPAGKHVVAFRFERPWWMTASWLAWPLLTLAAWLVMRRIERRGSVNLPRARIVDRRAPIAE
ncbi:MAG: YfhO family protein [Myxococcota bacterium]|nr:YfhO family protein [Myxococcota bacterium]